MKVLLVTIIVLLSSLTAYAQNNWFKITVPGMKRVELMQFLDRDTGYVIALGTVSGNDSFYLCKTTSGGREWDNISFYPKYKKLSKYFALRDNTMLDFRVGYNNTFYALGTTEHSYCELYRGNFFLASHPDSIYWFDVLRTPDLPSNYQTMGSDRMHFFTGIETSFVFSWLGWDTMYYIHGQRLLKGNLPLKQKENTILDHYSYDVAFAGANAGLAATDSGIYYSTDTGKTWSFIDTNSLGITRLAYGGNDSWLGTAPRKGLFRTVDTGKTWQPLLQSNSQNYSFDLKEKIGYVAADSELFVTTDQGKDWDRYDYKFKKVQALDEEIGFAITPKGELYKTATGGKPNLTVTESSQKLFASKEFTVYPQPASQQVTIAFADLSGHRVVKVVNSIGQVVLREVVPAGQRSLPLSVTALRSGLYFVETGGGQSHPLLIRH